MLVRCVDLDDDERWTVTIGLSLIIVYFIAFTGFLMDAPTQTSWVIMAACGACCWTGRRSLRAMLTNQIGAAQAIGLILVVSHGLLLAAAIRNFNGLLWAGDWFEHYERALFFILRPDPANVRFLEYLPEPYRLPARPPFMNVLVAEAVSLGPPHFVSFQVASTAVSGLACIPATALASRLARALRLDAAEATYSAAAGLVLLPAFAQNSTFPWTKLLTAFFVLAALLMLWRETAAVSPVRLVLAGLFLGAAISVHYSAAVFALPIGIAFTLRGFRKGNHVVSAAALAIPAALVLIPWLAYAIAVFGPVQTFGSNTTVTDAAGLGLVGNAVKIMLNLRDTFIPHFLRRSPPLMEDLMRQGNSWAQFRDWWFAPLQVNFPMSVGTVTQLIVVAVMVFHARWLPVARRLIMPWLPILAAAILLGIAVHGARDTIGLAHICLQPVILLTVAAAMVLLPQLPRWLQVAALAGLAWDYVVGVILHIGLETLPIRVEEFVEVDGSAGVGNRFRVGGAATMNAFLKETGGLVFLGDMTPEPVWFLAAAVLLGMVCFMIIGVWALRPRKFLGVAGDGPLAREVA
jgi:hypothetical protein